MYVVNASSGFCKSGPDYCMARRWLSLCGARGGHRSLRRMRARVMGGETQNAVGQDANAGAAHVSKVRPDGRCIVF
jgi:hypothetical protein